MSDEVEPDDAFARQLLRSASGDRSPRGARTRAIAALGVGSGLTASATTKAAALVVNNGAASGLAGAGLKTGGAMATKWLAVAILGGLATTGVVAVQATSRPTPVVQVSARDEGPRPTVTSALPLTFGQTEPTASALAVPLPPATASAPVAVTSPRAPVARPAPTTAPEHVATVAEQAHVLDEARVTIAAGNGPRGLSLLDDFARRFPKSPLGEEALVLRIEALVASGDSYAAKASASRFFARYPSSPYARRVRSIVGETAPE